jgi:hypothetical protein
MIYQKRQHWCFRDAKGKLHKFATEADAKAAHGVEDAPEEKTLFEEETSTYEQEVVFESEGGSEEEI